MSDYYIQLPPNASATWRDPVATSADLPMTGNNLGDARVAQDLGFVFVWNGSSWINNGGSGTVTSVSLTAPSILNVSGVPITGAGTIGLTLANQTANQVFAGPTSGGAAAPSFRSLVAADIPSLPYVPTSRTVSTVSPLTGGGDLSANRTIQFITVPPNLVLAGPTSGGSASPSFRSLVAGDIPSLSSLYANITLSNLGTVALNSDLLPATDFSRSLGSFSKRFNKIYADGLYGSANTKIFDFFSVTISDNSSVISADFLNRTLKSNIGTTMLDWLGTDLVAGADIIPGASYNLGDTDHLWNKIYPTYVQGNNDQAVWDIYSGDFFDGDTDNYAQSLNVISRQLYDSASGDVRLSWDKNIWIYSYPTDLVNPGNGNLILSSGPNEVTVGGVGSIVSFLNLSGGTAEVNRPSLLIGTSANGGLIASTSDASLAIGKVEGTDSILSANSDASFATGMIGVTSQGLIYATGNAAWANGIIASDFGRIEAGGNSSRASGYVSGNGASSNYIEAMATASRAEGTINSGDDSYISSIADAAVASGYIGSGTSYILANANGSDVRAVLAAEGTRAYTGGDASFIRTFISGTNSYMDVNGSGGWGGGYIENGDLEINNTGVGYVRLSGGHVRLESEGGFAFVSSDCDTNSYAYVYGEANFMVLKMDGTAAYAETNDDAASMFVRNNSGSAYSTGKGSQVRGDIGVNGASGGVLRASAEAATVIGRATEGGVIEATGTLTWSWGDDSKGNISTTGNRGASWGSDIENTGSDAYVFGYSLSNADSDRFIVGFGTPMLTVTGTEVNSNSNFNLKYHEQTEGTAPTVTLNANAGSTATYSVTAGSTDVAGEIVVTTDGAGKSQGVLATVTFHSSYANAPFVILGAGSVHSAIHGIYVTNVTNTSFDLAIDGGNPNNLDQYSFIYRAIEPK